ncbi:MAG: inositol 2-dehydrogenase [Spirochaetes bacterium]|nr:MAG: inositol 2-dehydrogenase [Spirochaetota bacterium]
MSKNLKIGIIGGGRIGKVHAANLTTRVSGVEVAVMADPFAGKELETWAADRGITRVIKDYKLILNDAAIDAVLICSPTDTHASISQEAALAGKHIFCEKPLNQDPDVIRKTLEVVKKAGVVFQIGFNRRFDHNFRALRQAVVDGSVGDVHLLCITSRDPEPPPVEYVRVSGGLFMDMAIHDFDMARYLTGSEIVKVHAAGAVLVDPAIGREGDIDTAITTLWFENGALGVIDNSRKATYGYDQRAEVFGSKGAAQSANDTPSTVRVSDSDRVESEKPLYFFLERYAESFAEELREFVKAIRDGAEVPGQKAALNSVLIALAAKKSLETGLPVDVEQT